VPLLITPILVAYTIPEYEYKYNKYSSSNLFINMVHPNSQHLKAAFKTDTVHVMKFEQRSFLGQNQP
jgi:hypothetical protein